MEILTEETFFILTQPRCFSACDIFFLAVVRTVAEAGSREKLLGSTLIFGNPSQSFSIKTIHSSSLLETNKSPVVNIHFICGAVLRISTHGEDRRVWLSWYFYCSLAQLCCCPDCCCCCCCQAPPSAGSCGWSSPARTLSAACWQSSG